MITDAILIINFFAIKVILSPLTLLPDATLPVDLTDAISTAGTYLAAVSSMLPITTFLLILGTVLAIESFIFSYKVIMWIIQKIPGIN